MQTAWTTIGLVSTLLLSMQLFTSDFKCTDDAVKFYSMNPMHGIVPCHEVHGWFSGLAATMSFAGTLVSSTMFVNVTMVPDAAIGKWAKQMGFWQVLPSLLMLAGCSWYGMDLVWLAFIVYGNSFGIKISAVMCPTLLYCSWIFFKSNKVTGDLVQELADGSYTALPEGK